jgi:hypothetical protein
LNPNKEAKTNTNRNAKSQRKQQWTTKIHRKKQNKPPNLEIKTLA